MKQTNNTSINLNKYISSTGVCSRREAEKWITAGRVTINGNIAILGNRVSTGDIVMVDGQKITEKPKPLYIALNKPIGIVCTTDPKERMNIVDFIGHKERLFPIGRLDKPSEGLIFLTNDGDIVNKILRAGNNHEKQYIVKTDKPITPDFIKKMSGGIPILGTVTKKCEVKKLDNHTFSIVLTQGLNRQIRRMCEYLGYQVMRLKRTRIMNVHLADLKPGHWRELTTIEMEQIQRSIANSSKTQEASVIQKNKTYSKPAKNKSNNNRNFRSRKTK